ncbi:CobW/HypB/UreG, nucleotide-binding domain-containing protein [Lasiosphaeria hispida]|uniref:CobW/HypB/UreG, nucleotide-binding domain-containing protein n=1 Tax=Lasiosphaeria hispida TaxID=260671 RepID=A0AAJ0MI20_9PEZI|nr:CobW/HypB/UreG, nucleotide-binding domain-containing protein [Lasiosphaeria hispida]
MTTPTAPTSPPTTAETKGPIPITIITGFLGSGKTTLILNLLPQLRAANPGYRLALLKNEFGDVAVDSQLAASGAISGVQELLGGCICCNLVGQLSTALAELRATVAPDRIVVETSGSAFPATLALEVNRLARETGGAYALDGVVSVVDVENWKGYEDTSYTARLQARYTDLIVFNKWEECEERRFDECLDRLGDLELDTPWVRSDKGWVSMDLVFGIDGGLARGLDEHAVGGHDHEHKDDHSHDHQSEVEVLSIELKSSEGGAVDVGKLHTLLKTAPREEVYRIKAVLSAAGTVRNSDEDTGIPTPPPDGPLHSRYILNWAFGRWTFTPVGTDVKEHESSSDSILRMTMILARYESTKWKKRLETAGFLAIDGGGEAELSVTKII